MSDVTRASLGWRQPRCSRRGWFASALALGVIACSGPPPRTANPTRPLDERRAVEIMIRAFHEEKDRPVPGRKIELTAGKRLEVDVGSQGKKYGVAYVTVNERMALGSALPPRDPAMGDALQLVRGLGPEADARILILHDSEYQYDDQLGAERSVTSITAERKLERDVRDFLVRAHAERWP
jgi:hypothetical protein